jgi:hypothetical protein
VGQHRPLSSRARHLLNRLRASKVWSVQKQIIAELVHEIRRGTRRLRDVARERGGQKIASWWQRWRNNAPKREARRQARRDARAARKQGRADRRAAGTGRGRRTWRVVTITYLAIRHPGWGSRQVRRAAVRRRADKADGARARIKAGTSRPGDRGIVNKANRSAARRAAKAKARANGQTFGQRARKAALDRQARKNGQTAPPPPNRGPKPPTARDPRAKTPRPRTSRSPMGSRSGSPGENRTRTKAGAGRASQTGGKAAAGRTSQTGSKAGNGARAGRGGK